MNTKLNLERNLKSLGAGTALLLVVTGCWNELPDEWAKTASLNTSASSVSQVSPSQPDCTSNFDLWTWQSWSASCATPTSASNRSTAAKFWGWNGARWGSPDLWAWNNVGNKAWPARWNGNVERVAGWCTPSKGSWVVIAVDRKQASESPNWAWDAIWTRCEASETQKSGEASWKWSASIPISGANRNDWKIAVAQVDLNFNPVAWRTLESR